MYNSFIYEKAKQTREKEQEEQERQQEISNKHRTKNQGLFNKFEKRLQSVIEYVIRNEYNNDQRLDNPLPELQNFVLNETLHNILQKTNYKVGSENIKGFPVFRMTFNTSEKQRINSIIEQNRIFSPEFTPTKPTNFRRRNKEKDIHPPMKFRITNYRLQRDIKSPNESVLNPQKNEIYEQNEIGDYIHSPEAEPRASRERKSENLEAKRKRCQILCSLLIHQNLRISLHKKSRSHILKNRCTRHFSNMQTILRIIGFALAKENKDCEERLNLFFYPNLRRDSPKKILLHNKQLNLPTETIQTATNETKLEFEVESDAGSLDDEMLTGQVNFDKRRKTYDPREIQKQIIRNKTTSQQARDVLVKAKALRVAITNINKESQPIL